jgi:hypothetical protein
MLFIDNKYTRWYYNIINTAKARQINTGYTERHHIIPRSLDGTDDADNLVDLTAHEHFVCHLLLPKMLTGKPKRSMCYAAWQMTNVHNRERYSPTARIYSLLKEQLSKSYKGVPKTYSSFAGKRHTEETKRKQSDVKIGKNNPMWGRKQSTKTIEAISSSQKGIQKPKFVCEYCNKIIGGKANYIRWHGNNCSINTL